MSFFEDIASALDAEGIESRVNDDIMFVPITAELEIQFVEIDPILPAANVYIAAADVDEDDDDFEAVLVSVVFSVEDAVATVSAHVATDQVVTVLRDLLEGTDERIGDLEFYQDMVNANLVRAEVGENSEIQVYVEVIDKVPSAAVQFVVQSSSYDDLLDSAIDEFWDSDTETSLTEADRQRLFNDLQAEVADEVLDLGVFVDFDKLFDVLSLAADQADIWESQLDPFDDADFDAPDVFDLFAEDDDFDDEDDEHDFDGHEEFDLAEDPFGDDEDDGDGGPAAPGVGRRD